MIRYRAPGIEPDPPIVDQWLAAMSADAMPYVPWLMIALVASWCLWHLAVKILSKLMRRGAFAWAMRGVGEHGRTD